MKQLSIIIPVYNVEDYIHSCLDSIFRQGLEEECYEIIIVNDGTKDNSMNVITNIIDQHHNIRILVQENLGLSVARNNGLKIATGEYILFVDSDDIIIDYSIKPLLNKAIEEQPDLFVANYLKMNNEAILNYQSPQSNNEKYSIKVTNGESLFLKELHPRQCYVWRTLYRRNFLIDNDIRFISGICFEDIPFTHTCYLNAKKCLKTEQPIYLYRIGNASITGNTLTKEKAIHFCIVISELWKMSKSERWNEDIRQRLKDNAFDIFSLLFYSITEEIHDNEVKIQIVRHLKEIVPDLSFSHGYKQKIVTFLYRCMPIIYLTAKKYYQTLAKKYIY